MKLVYATGRPRNFEFAVASGPAHLPAGARVLAVCDGRAADSLLDEQTFGAMTDEEFYTLQSLIAASRGSESARPNIPARPAATTGPLRRFFRRVAGRS